MRQTRAVVDLLDRWRIAARGAGAGSGLTSTGAGEQLLARWREPHRHYHTVAHLTAVLDVVDEHADLAGRPDVVRLAAWFHDAVYDPRAAGDANERDSAALAESVLAGLGVPAPTAAEVRRLVLLTAGHTVAPGDPDGALLCDADLAVLAAPPADYDRYAAAIRREYAHVPEPAFRAGRAAVLTGLLALPALFRLPPLAARWEEPARDNVRRELAALSEGSTGAG
ncbi:putative metal-dependent HD superfamily phosphohydrolase [Micromonospora sp. A202]|nr:putative metal-dependent HD superfamily phosphohydrolase [Micromonospora sp. A202]